MRAHIEEQKLLTDGMNLDLKRRLSVVIVDASTSSMSVALSVLEFHEVVDLIGRAANFEEIVQLLLNQQPDVVLVDLEMPLANVAILAITLAGRGSVKIIGMCTRKNISLVPVETLTAVDALIHKECLREKFLAILYAHFGSTAASFSISSPPKPEQAANQWRSGTSCRDAN
jgi:DNA-binding NarL/FixJ family response regulator